MQAVQLEVPGSSDRPIESLNNKVESETPLIPQEKKMVNWKAIIFGWVATVLASLINNLIFVLIVAYIANSESIPFFAEHGTKISYAIGIIGLFIAMAFGGFVTAFCARGRVIFHGAIVGLLASITSLALTTHAGALTFISLLFIVAATFFTVVGCIIWSKCSTYTSKVKQTS